jgi:hypothetical protein
LRSRRRKSPDSVAYVLGNPGLVEFARGNLARATALQMEALTIRRGLTNHSALAKCLENVALLAAAQHQPERATLLFAAASHLRVHTGSTVPPNDAELNDRYMSQAKSQLGDSAFELCWVTGEDITIAEAVDLALDPHAPIRAGVHDASAHSLHSD